MNELPSGWNLPPGVFEHMIPGNREENAEELFQEEWAQRGSEVLDLFTDDFVTVDDALDIVAKLLAERRRNKA